MLYLPSEEGRGMVQYALILLFVAIVVLFILALLSALSTGYIYSNIYSIDSI